MNALMIVINILLILVAIVLVVAVLLQQGQRQGLGAIGGGAETFFGKSKAKGYEGKLLLITKIGAAVFVVLAIAMTIITSHLNKDDGNVPANSGDVTADATDALPSETATDELVDATPAAEATDAPAEGTGE